MYCFVNKEKYCQIWTCLVLFYFTLLDCVHFHFCNYKSHWFTLVIYDQEKIMSDLSMCHGKVTEFVSIPLFRFTLVIKLRNFNFESHWNILMFFDKETYDVRFADFHGKMSDFVSFLLFGFTLVRKLRNFDFKGH